MEKTESTPEMDNLDSTTRYLAIAQLASGWAKHLSALAALEFSQSAEAIRQSIVLKVALFPMLFLLYVSLVGCASYLSFSIANSAYYAVATCLGIQIAAVALVMSNLHRLKKLVGFKHTIAQVQEVKDEITKIFEKEH